MNLEENKILNCKLKSSDPEVLRLREEALKQMQIDMDMQYAESIAAKEEHYKTMMELVESEFNCPVCLDVFIQVN